MLAHLLIMWVGGSRRITVQQENPSDELGFSHGLPKLRLRSDERRDCDRQVGLAFAIVKARSFRWKMVFCLERKANPPVWRKLSAELTDMHLGRRRNFGRCVFALCLALQATLHGQSLLRRIDLSHDSLRQVVVDRQPGQYLGHPTTVLLEDGTTIIVVYPEGHGRGAIVMKRSSDGGMTWSERLPVPGNWSTSLETPTIHRIFDQHGRKRLILFSGLYPARSSVSEDDGLTWTPLAAIGPWGGIVVMSSVVPLHDGRSLAMFHDDGRFFRAEGRRSTVMTLYKSFSGDGGLSWSEPEVVFAADTAQLCEPGLLRSPDGKQLAALLRENTRSHNSFVIFSDDEGRSWSAPRELPASLTGDRHTAKYAPDGRVVVSFRDMARSSPTYGDWVAWVGSYDDIVSGTEGQYHVRLMDNLQGADCGYPGVEVLPDGTFVLTSYGHWIQDEPPFIVSVRLRLSEFD